MMPAAGRCRSDRAHCRSATFFVRSLSGVDERSPVRLLPGVDERHSERQSTIGARTLAQVLDRAAQGEGAFAVARGLRIRVAAVPAGDPPRRVAAHRSSGGAAGPVLAAVPASRRRSTHVTAKLAATSKRSAACRCDSPSLSITGHPQAPLDCPLARVPSTPPAPSMLASFPRQHDQPHPLTNGVSLFRFDALSSRARAC
jgi:hypothetical protein